MPCLRVRVHGRFDTRIACMVHYQSGLIEIAIDHLVTAFQVEGEVRCAFDQKKFGVPENVRKSD